MAKKQRSIYEIKIKGLEDLKSLNKEVQNLNKKYDGLKKGSEGASKSTKGVGDSAKGSALGLGKLAKGAAVAGAALIAFNKISKILTNQVKEGIQVFKGFEFEMAKVKAISGATDDEFKKLNETAQDLGRSTFFTAKEVASLQLNFSKLGFTATEVLQAQEAALLTATATGEDLARTATVIGSTIRGFGLDASESARVADVMAASFTSSALTLEKFQTSMTKVSPVAKLLGIDLEETTAIMGVLTDAGIEASIAGTSLRNIFLKLGDPSSDLAKSIGFTVNSGEDMVREFRRMRDEGINVEKMLEVVDVRQVAAISTMIEHIDKIEAQTESFRNSTGAASDMADVIGDTLEGSVKRFQSALDGLRIVLVDIIAPLLTSVTDTFAKLFNNIALSVEGFDSLEQKMASNAKESLILSNRLQSLKDRHQELSEKTDKTKEEHFEMSEILIDLQNELGNSVTRINDETGALELNGDALDEVIERHALLADKEAIKLAHQLRKTKKEIDQNSNAQTKLAGSISMASAAMHESKKTQDDVTKSTINMGNGMKVLGDMEGNLAEETLELTNKNSKLAEQQQRVNGLNEKMRVLKKENNDLIEKENELKSLLLDAGFDEAALNRILIEQEVKKQELSDLKTRTKVTTDDEDPIGDADAIAQMEMAIENEKQELLTQFAEGEIRTKEELNEKLKELELDRINFVIDNNMVMGEDLINLERRLAKIRSDIRDSEISEEEKRIAQMKETGKLLMQIGEQEGENSRVRKIGIKITQAAAVAEGFLALQSAFGSITRQGVSGDPFTAIIRVAAMAAQLASVISNLKALLGSSGGGGGGEPRQYSFESDLETFSHGGLTKGGVFVGNSHANGGVKFAVGGRVMEAEGGEAIINKKSTKMFRPMLSAINSYNGNGVKFADGGLLNSGEKFALGGQLMSAQQLVSGGSSAANVLIVESDVTDVQSRISTIESQASF